MALRDIIIDKIRTEGPISFREYMDMCLYYPDLGYYSTEIPKIGTEGDFYTSSSLSSSYGAALAKQMEEMWRNLNKTDFTIVEFGAGLGSLCRDILLELSKDPKLYKGLRYCIIEKSPAMRLHEQELLIASNKVNWFGGVKDIPWDIDCVFSNELFDNFPVHLVTMKEQLMEIFVGYDGSFTEVLRPAGVELLEYFSELGVKLAKGYRAEVNLDALDWIKEISDFLKKGYVMTIDYGDISEQLYKPHRRDGTIVCYYKHKVSQDPFYKIGEQDITAHINFSALENCGEKMGFDTCGITPQAYFLISLGIREHIKEANMSKGTNTKNIIQMAREEAFISHTLLFDMGIKYKVLIQSRGVPETQLTGLSLA